MLGGVLGVRARRWLAAPVLAGALFAGAELVHWRASRRGLRRGADTCEGPEVVLVLGHPALESGQLHPMQRWRTEIAVRSMRSADARLVFSGAGRGGAPSEAEVMAAHAHADHGVPLDRIGVETRALSTWENVAYSLDELERAATIRIASTPVHAARARRYLRAQRPDLAGRLAPADDHRLGERMGMKLATAVQELVGVLYDRLTEGRAPA